MEERPFGKGTRAETAGPFRHLAFMQMFGLHSASSKSEESQGANRQTVKTAIQLNTG